MRLTFPAAQLRDLLIFSEERWPKGQRERYGEPNDGPGLWLVGDQGVYLMTNAVLADGEKSLIVYAAECDPTTMDFDEWWAVKQASFGGDDGVEFIDADTIRWAVRDESPLLVDFTPNEMAISHYEKKPKSGAKPSN